MALVHRTVLRRNEILDGMAEQFGGLPTEQPENGSVGQSDSALTIDNQHGAGYGVAHLGQQVRGRLPISNG